MLYFNKLISFIKDLQVLFAFLGLSSIAFASHLDESLELVKNYNLHILFFYFIGIVLIYKLLQKQINEMNNKLDAHLVKASEDRLKGQVKQLAKELEDVKEITFKHTINYILDLEKRRVELGLNSFTQATLENLMSRIKEQG